MEPDNDADSAIDNQEGSDTSEEEAPPPKAPRGGRKQPKAKAEPKSGASRPRKSYRNSANKDGSQGRVSNTEHYNHANLGLMPDSR